jgi:hypothetical protein
MAETAHSIIEAQAPQAQLIQMATGYWISSLVYFAAQMKLADQLAEGPKTADELAPALIQAQGLADRIKIEGGSFFESVPAGGSAYLLSHITHDWNEAQCLTILGNCRRQMKPNSRLLIIEMVLPTGNTPHPGKMLDMIMLTIAGGQERTEPEYRVLLDKARFRLTRVVPTESAVSVVEAVPA